MRRLDSMGQKHLSSDVTPPTLLIWGTNDIALEKGMAITSMKFCRDGTTRFIEGASHWVQQDEPQLCIQYMKEFLKK